VLTGRLAGRAGGPLAALAADAARLDHIVRVLTVLTSFETFDGLAGPDQQITAAVPDVLRLTEAALQFG
jgi:hypothetical protein